MANKGRTLKSGFASLRIHTREILRNSLFLLSFGMAFLFLMASTANATTGGLYGLNQWVVNTISDSTTDTACTTRTSCTLRGAILAADNDTDDVITFKPGLTGTIKLAGQLNVTSNMFIIGPGADILAISGQDSTPIFNVSAAGVTIVGLTLADGDSTGDGGAIYLDASGNLYVDRCAFTDNKAVNHGGAIYDANGSLTVTNSTFSGNQSTGTGNTQGGGAIADTSTSSSEALNVVNSTFYDNSAALGGGAISNYVAGTSTAPKKLVVVNNTFVDNSAQYGSAVEDYNSTYVVETVENNIFAGNKNPGSAAVRLDDYTGLAEGYNLFYDNTAGGGNNVVVQPNNTVYTLATSDKTGEDPKLLPLGYYGGDYSVLPSLLSGMQPADYHGATQTMMPEVNSPVIGKGSASDLTNVLTNLTNFLPLGPQSDQRGFPISSTFDIGSVQTNYQLVTSLSSDPNTSGSLPAVFNTAATGSSDADIGFDTSHGSQFTIQASASLSLSPESAATHIVIIGTPAVVTISGAGDSGIPIVQMNAANAPANLTLYGLTFVDATASAIVNDGGTLTVSGSTFAGNNSGGNGGAIINESVSNSLPATLTVANSTFFNNSATDSGGAIYNSNGSTGGNAGSNLTVTNSTFVQNFTSPTGTGGAIYNYSTTGTTAFVTNSIFSRNSAGTAGAIEPGGTLAESYNLYYLDGSAPLGARNPSGTDVQAQPYLVALGYYGGSTETMMPVATLSKEIGAGTSAVLPAGLPGGDQRGFPMSSNVDIGAVQTNYLVVNTASDSTETTPCSATDTTCSLRDAITLAQSSPGNRTDIGFSDIPGGVNIDLTKSLDLSEGNTVIVATLGVFLNGNNSFPLISTSGSSTSLSLSGLALEYGSSGNGGAIDNATGATVNVNYCYFTGNIATHGGAIYNDTGSTATVTGSTFDTYNAGAGGAIYNDGTMTVTNSTFYGYGSFAGGGGAIYVSSSGVASIGNNTFYDNHADAGAAIYNAGAITVADNIFSNGLAVFPNDGAAIYKGGGTVSEDYNLFYQNHDYSSTTEDDTNLGSYGTHDVQDANTNPSPVAALSYNNFNGFQSDTGSMLPVPGSPAICKGAITPLATDQLGYPRLNTTYQGFSASNPCIDIGSVQTNYQSIQFESVPSGGYVSLAPGKFASPSPIVSVTENGKKVAGVPVTLTVNNLSTSAVASGIGPVQTDSSGEATFNSLTVDTAGSYTLSSTLNVTPDITLTTSATPTYTVDSVAVKTTTTVTYSPNPAVYGNTVTFTAVVTADSGTSAPEGSVNFSINSATVVGAEGTCPNGTADYSTCFVYSTDTLSAGSYTVTASYLPGKYSNLFDASEDSTGVSFTIESATYYIQSLGTSTTLTSGQVKSLVREWDKAYQMAEAGKFNGAINNLNDFISEVNDLYSSGVLTQTQATTLLTAAKYQINLYREGLL